MVSRKGREGYKGAKAVMQLQQSLVKAKKIQRYSFVSFDINFFSIFYFMLFENMA